MSSLPAELSNLLFKKYSGVVDTSSSKSVTQEPAVLAYPKIIPSVQIYAQPIPSIAPLQSDLSINSIINITGIVNSSGVPQGTSADLSALGYCEKREVSIAYPYIVKYTKLLLKQVDATGFAYNFAGTNVNLLSSTNILSQVIPYSYDPSAPGYQYAVYIWDAASNGYNLNVGSSDPTNPWVLDIDAGYIRFFGVSSPDPAPLGALSKPPRITFWRYEGTMGFGTDGGGGGDVSGGGPTGAQGPTGAVGPTGTEGPTGPRGVGERGSAGSASNTGATGPTGGLGPTGPKGDPSETTNPATSEITILVGTNTTNTTIYYTYNGKEWNEQNIITPSGSQTLNCTVSATNKTMFLIGCSGEGIAYSTNGLQWNYSTTAKTLFSTSNCNALVWGSYQWIAVTNTFFATSKDGVLWTKSNKPRFVQNLTTNISLCNWSAIAYNGYMWVSMGSYNNAQGIGAYSLDGVQWTAYIIADISNSSVVACNSSIWLSACTTPTQNQIYSSIDGLNWSPVTNTSFNCQTICSNGSIWLAGGLGISISDISGQNWQQIQQGTTLTIGNTTLTPLVNGTIDMTTKTIKSICWNGTIWIATSSTILYYSNNGYDWFISTPPTKIIPGQGLTTNSFLASKNSQLEDIKTTCSIKSVTDNFSVLVGSKQTAYSYDGLKWFNNLNPIAEFYSVKYNGFLWVACGLTFAYSYDGIAWKQSTGVGATFTGIEPPTNIVNTLNTHTGPSICPSSEPTYGTTVCSAQPTAGTASIKTTGWTDIAVRDNTWVAIGYANKIATSTDGINWPTIYSLPDVQLNAIATNDTMWIAVGQAVTVYSFNTDYWIINDLSPINANSISYNGSIWVIVGTPVSSSSPYIMYSKNGIDWTPGCLLGSSTITAVILYTVGWNGSFWITGGICSTGPVFYYSMDAKNWYLAQDIPEVISMGKSVSWNGENWLAMGQTGKNMLTSTDGIIWTQNTKTNLEQTLGQTWYSVSSRKASTLNHSLIDNNSRLISNNLRPISDLIFSLPEDHACAHRYLRERPNYRLRVELTKETSLTLPYIKPWTTWYIQNMTLWPLLTILAPDGTTIIKIMSEECLTINFYDSETNYNIVSDY